MVFSCDSSCTGTGPSRRCPEWARAESHLGGDSPGGADGDERTDIQRRSLLTRGQTGCSMYPGSRSHGTVYVVPQCLEKYNKYTCYSCDGPKVEDDEPGDPPCYRQGAATTRDLLPCQRAVFVRHM